MYTYIYTHQEILSPYINPPPRPPIGARKVFFIFRGILSLLSLLRALALAPARTLAPALATSVALAPVPALALAFVLARAPALRCSCSCSCSGPPNAKCKLGFKGQGRFREDWLQSVFIAGGVFN